MTQTCRSENEKSNKWLFPINKSLLLLPKDNQAFQRKNVFVQFLSSSPNDRATSDGGGVATFWCEQCTMTTFVRLLKTRSATSIVKDWQLWAIRAWIAHCARAPQSGSTIHQQPHWPWTKAHVDAADDNDADEVFLRHRMKKWFSDLLARLIWQNNQKGWSWMIDQHR